MKTLILILSLLFISNISWGYEPSEINNQDFEKLNKLENYLNKNPELDFETLKIENPEMVKNLDLAESTGTINAATAGDMPLVGGFWWGCCLGPLGLALVYFMTDNDRSQTKKALVGCVIAVLLWGVGGLWNPFGW